MSVETIEVETGFGSCHPVVTVRISATDLVILAKAMKGREYLDVCVTDGIRRIANPEMILPDNEGTALGKPSGRASVQGN